MRIRFAVALSLALPVGVFAQGSLTPPPGSPGPVMRTLEQVEPRIPITNLPYTISAPGSYYLTTNFTVGGGAEGITISANDVDLDLSGFVLSGAGGGNNGIVSVGNQANVRIRNGTVRNWSNAGVNISGIQNGQVEHVRASANGSAGIQTGPGTTIINCTASLNFNIGIYAGANNLVKECVANGNFVYGIQALQGSSVLDCVAGANTNAGIFAGGSGCTISRNSARLNGGSGISGSAGCTIVDNTVYLNAGHGIFASSGSTIARNQCATNGAGAGFGAGVYCSGSDNRITDNHLIGNDAGIQLDGARNYVAGNTVRGNADNYAFAAGNELNLLLSQIPESIDWPAMVALAGSLSATSSNQQGVVINANNVTFDLMGHTLTGVAGSSNGIFIATGRQGVKIMNGTLTQWGRNGIDGSSASNCTYIALNTHENVASGLLAGYNSTLKDCSSVRNGSRGYYIFDHSTVKDCVASDNRAEGIAFSSYCVLERCLSSGQTNISGTGFYMIYGNVLESCRAEGNRWGFVGTAANKYLQCVAINNINYGIQGSSHDLVKDCTINNNGFYGLGYFSANGAHIEGNSAHDNGIALQISGTNNFVVRNRAWLSTSGTNYIISAGNHVGPITNSPANATSPWANFSH